MLCSYMLCCLRLFVYFVFVVGFFVVLDFLFFFVAGFFVVLEFLFVLFCCLAFYCVCFFFVPWEFCWSLFLLQGLGYMNYQQALFVGFPKKTRVLNLVGFCCSPKRRYCLILFDVSLLVEL